MSNLKNIKLSQVEIEYQEMNGRVDIIKESAVHRISVIDAQIVELEAERKRLNDMVYELDDWINIQRDRHSYSINYDNNHPQ